MVNIEVNMEFVNKVKIYHGSPYKFDEFNQEGLGFNEESDGVMAITAGFYFTTDLNEALEYAQGGYIYETELNFGLGYKAGKDYEFILKNKEEKGHQMRFICLSNKNDIISDLHSTITSSQVKRMLKLVPNWKEKLSDYHDIDIKDASQVNSALNSVAKDYAKICKDDMLYGLNCLGNDWFIGKEETYILNQAFAKATRTLAFTKEMGRDEEGNQRIHFCFLDGSLIPKFQVHDLSLENYQVIGNKFVITENVENSFKP